MWELIFVISGAFWHTFWVPGASNLSGFFVKFLGGAPGSLLGAFWMPFGCPLGALGTSLGDFGSALAALVGRFAEVVPGGLLQHFFIKEHNFSISEILLKAWQAQCFSRSRHPGGREKVTKKVVGIRWKN